MNTICQPVMPGEAVAAGDGGPISRPSPAAQVLSARQAQLLRAIRTTWPSGAFNNTRAEIETLRALVGWKTRGHVTVALHALRAKGLLRSEGRSKAGPNAWEIAA